MAVLLIWQPWFTRRNVLFGVVFGSDAVWKDTQAQKIRLRYLLTITVGTILIGLGTLLVYEAVVFAIFHAKSKRSKSWKAANGPDADLVSAQPRAETPLPNGQAVVSAAWLWILLPVLLGTYAVAALGYPFMPAKIPTHYSWTAVDAWAPKSWPMVLFPALIGMATTAVLLVCCLFTRRASASVRGTPSSSPTVPILQSNQLPLAQITVGNNVSVINSNVIMDMWYPVLSHDSYAGKGEPFFGPAANVPWSRLIPDGREISRARYARLFASIGTTCGAGDGSTTFNLPDARKNTLVGYMSGNANFGTLGAQIGCPMHTQSFANPIGHAGGTPYILRSDSWQSYNTAFGATDAAEIHFVTDYTQTGSAQGQNAEVHKISMTASSIQPSLVVNWLIVW